MKRTIIILLILLLIGCACIRPIQPEPCESELWVKSGIDRLNQYLDITVDYKIYQVYPCRPIWHIGIEIWYGYKHMIWQSDCSPRCECWELAEKYLRGE